MLFPAETSRFNTLGLRFLFLPLISLFVVLTSCSALELFTVKKKPPLFALNLYGEGFFFFGGEKEMKDENVNRGSARVSDDVLYVSPYFLFYFSAFLISLRMF